MPARAVRVMRVRGPADAGLRRDPVPRAGADRPAGDRLAEPPHVPAGCRISAAPPALTPNSPLTVSTSAETPLESAKRIDRKDAIQMVKDKKAVWIDVRPADIYNEGHIVGAINIPLSDLLRRLKDLPPNKYYITYCA